MDKETQELIEMMIDEEQVDETWRKYHESISKPKIKLSDLDPKTIELIIQNVMVKIEMDKMLKEELEWLAKKPEYTW